mmetsp:Transcript_43772/g.121135  ORF Transcript_43772/g.121135 Transcript_43772/m.121135 type:complete len:219 (-) Transcript_43772:63-719(-)
MWCAPRRRSVHVHGQTCARRTSSRHMRSPPPVPFPSHGGRSRAAAGSRGASHIGTRIRHVWRRSHGDPHGEGHAGPQPGRHRDLHQAARRLHLHALAAHHPHRDLRTHERGAHTKATRRRAGARGGRRRGVGRAQEAEGDEASGGQRAGGGGGGGAWGEGGEGVALRGRAVTGVRAGRRRRRCGRCGRFGLRCGRVRRTVTAICCMPGCAGCCCCGTP